MGGQYSKDTSAAEASLQDAADFRSFPAAEPAGQIVDERRRRNDGLPDGAKVSYDIISDRGRESAGNLRLK